MSNNTNVISGIEQGRAKFAYECAQQGQQMAEQSKKKPPEGSYQRWDTYFHDKKYATYVKNVPMHIKTNGLGAALAFIFSKRKTETQKIDGQDYKPGTHKKNPQNAYAFIYQQITEWIEQKKLIKDFSTKANLVEEVIKLPSQQYRALTIEILALFNWLRRFADGLSEGEEGEEI